jgi:hypothetical protein
MTPVRDHWPPAQDHQVRPGRCRRPRRRRRPHQRSLVGRGDSGGPHFLGGKDQPHKTIVAITITGDRYCRSTDKTYRLDTPNARDFLDEFVTLP